MTEAINALPDLEAISSIQTAPPSSELKSELLSGEFIIIIREYYCLSLEKYVISESVT